MTDDQMLELEEKESEILREKIRKAKAVMEEWLSRPSLAVRPIIKGDIRKLIEGLDTQTGDS